MVEKPAHDPAFETLLGYIQKSRGVDFRGYKRTSLRRRIALRLAAAGAHDFAAYQAHLEANASEFESLLNTVLINVTSFFRDLEAWEMLRTEIIPQIVVRTDDRPIRVWSVGCASGEEPYSIAMLLAEVLGPESFCDRVKIYATDLDEDALRAARQATYTPREVEGMPPDLLEKHFERTQNHYVFNRDLRRCVIFGQHNVVKDAPISRIDLLVCRNLLIYLEAETQDLVLPRLHYALNGGGYLFLGKAETQLARSALFQPVDMKHRIFRKVAQEWRRTAGGGLANAPEFRPEASPQRTHLLESVLNESASAMLVVDANGIVTLTNLPARDLLAVGQADVGRPFQDLPVSYRPVELRGPIEEVLRNRRGVRLEHQEYPLPQADTMRLTVELKPLLRADRTVFAVLLSFTDTTRLHAMQVELQTAQENLENSIEELQSANEELETTNEELQSTNEELETINEEARSSNEEMESTNEELRLQAEQATGARTHLESVLRSLNMGVVVTDDRLVVQSWNRWSENAWGLRAEEVVGAALDTLDIGFPVHRVRADVAAVQSGRQASAEQVVEALDRRGRRILCRVHVNPLAPDAGHAPAGTVLTFEDVTEERRREEYTRYLGRVIGRALNEVYFLDPETLGFMLTNKGAEVKLECSAAQLTQMALPDIMPDVAPEDIQALIAPVLSGERPEIVFETTIRSVRGNEYPAEICLQYFADETPPILVAIVHDTTDRTRLAAE